MCGRFVSDISPQQLQEAYGLLSLPDITARYNIAPSQQVAVIRQNDAKQRELALLKWGLIPPWAKDASIGYKMINARSETVYEKPSFRSALKSRRCIFPVSGFYEWQKIGKEKVPHYIYLIDKAIMSLAGLWESWKSPEGVLIETCTILTTAANSSIKKIHDRMPVILHQDEIDIWLNKNVDDLDGLKELFHPYPSGLIQEHVVSKEVNNPKNDQPTCINPV